MSPAGTLTVSLRGYPEAVLATDTVALPITPGMTAGVLARDVASRSDRLVQALLHQDGTPRDTTKVIVGGSPVGRETPIDALDTVIVLASLPCDG